MNERVLWYVHDQGHGHAQRAGAVLTHLGAEAVIAAGPGVADLAATLPAEVVILPKDHDLGDPPTRGPWHHAPASASTRARFAALSDLVARHRCTTAVIDVSVETALWARFSGLRLVVVRQTGVRTDGAHRLAWASADRVLVPQHPALEPIPSAERRSSDRWAFTGAFSRFDDEPVVASGGADGTRRCLVVVGAGESTFPAGSWASGPAPAGWHVTIAGPAIRPSRPGVEFVGRVGRLWPRVCAADVVVTSAGWASVADAASAGRALVVVPERRPYDEQLVRARALADRQLAEHLERWPTLTELPALLERVSASSGDSRRRWAPFYDRRGARRAAAVIDEVHAG